ncbi:virulence factor, partial [Burkholderia cenocepacia]
MPDRRAGMAGSIGVFMHCFTLARRIGCVSIVMATFLSSPPLRAETRAASTQSVEGASAAPFVAQVVGLEWLNPLQRRDYPTEWQLLWT